MKESDLYADVVGGLNREGCAVWKIADGSTGKKPFDISGVAKGTGKAVGVEVKIASREPEAVGPDWRIFESHQVTWLRSYAASDAIALAAVYDRRHQVMHVWRLRDANDNCDRPADRLLYRGEGGMFTGWRALIGQKENNSGNNS